MISVCAPLCWSCPWLCVWNFGGSNTCGSVFVYFSTTLILTSVLSNTGGGRVEPRPVPCNVWFVQGQCWREIFSKQVSTWVQECHFCVIKGSNTLVLQVEAFFFGCPLINRKRSHARTNMSHRCWRDLCTRRVECGCRCRTVWLLHVFAGCASQCQLTWCTHGWMAPIWHSWRNWRQSRSKWKKSKELRGLSFSVLAVCYFIVTEV